GMIRLVANAKIGKLGIESGELIIHVRGAHGRAVALILRLSTHTLVLNKERLQVELLLVGFVKRVDIRLQPHLQSREYLDIVLQLFGQFSQVPGFEFAQALVLSIEIEACRFQLLVEELSGALWFLPPVTQVLTNEGRSQFARHLLSEHGSRRRIGNSKR